MTFVIACLIALTLAGILLVLHAAEARSAEPVKRVLAHARGRRAWRDAAARIQAGRR